MIENCQKCGELDTDRRTLWMECFYEMDELGIPFNKLSKGGREFYTLRVCKQCRGDWMKAIKTWFNSPIEENNCDSGIFVREYGKIFQVSEEEFHERRKNEIEKKDEGE